MTSSVLNASNSFDHSPWHDGLITRCENCIQLIQLLFSHAVGASASLSMDTRCVSWYTKLRYLHFPYSAMYVRSMYVRHHTNRMRYFRTWNKTDILSVRNRKMRRFLAWMIFYCICFRMAQEKRMEKIKCIDRRLSHDSECGIYFCRWIGNIFQRVFINFRGTIDTLPIEAKNVPWNRKSNWSVWSLWITSQLNYSFSCIWINHSTFHLDDKN